MLSENFILRKMKAYERLLVYIARARQLVTDLKSMDVNVDDAEIVMTVLSRLTEKFWFRKSNVYLIALPSTLFQMCTRLCLVTEGTVIVIVNLVFANISSTHITASHSVTRSSAISNSQTPKVW